MSGSFVHVWVRVGLASCVWDSLWLQLSTLGFPPEPVMRSHLGPRTLESWKGASHIFSTEVAPITWGNRSNVGSEAGLEAGGPRAQDGESPSGLGGVEEEL